MRIAISSKSGCGNTTVTTMVAKALGYPMINFTFRQLSEERGIEFWDFCAMAEKDDNIDREIDSRQVKMAMDYENCVLGSRLAIWMLNKADLKVYMTASDKTRAARIQMREGGSFEDQLAKTRARDEHDSARYLRIYGIDNNRPEKVADLVIETDTLSAEAVADMIVKKALDLINAK